MLKMSFTPQAYQRSDVSHNTYMQKSKQITHKQKNQIDNTIDCVKKKIYIALL